MGITTRTSISLLVVFIFLFIPALSPALAVGEELNVVKLYLNDNPYNSYSRQLQDTPITRSSALGACQTLIYDFGIKNKGKCMWGTETLYLFTPTVNSSTNEQAVVGNPLSTKDTMVSRFEMSIDGTPAMLNQMKKEFATMYCVPPAGKTIANIKCLYEGKDMLTGAVQEPLFMTLTSDKNTVEYGTDVLVSWDVKNSTQCYVENTLMEPKQINALNYRDMHFEVYGKLNSQRYFKVTAPLTVSIRCLNSGGLYESRSITVPLKKSTDPITPVTDDYRCVDITRDLSLGMGDVQISRLEDFLYSRAYLSAQTDANTFSQDILVGVKKFQSIQDIPEDGVIGPKTRARLKLMSCTTKAEMPTAGVVKLFADESSLPLTIGGYTRKSFQLNKSKCDETACYLTSTASYASSTDTINIVVDQVINPMSAFDAYLQQTLGEIRKRQSVQAGLDGKFEYCLLNDGLLCIIGGGKVLLQSTNEKLFLTNDAHLKEFKENKDYLLLLSRRKQALSQNEVVSYFLGALSSSTPSIAIPVVTPKEVRTAACISLTSDLTLGSKHSSVLKLQQFLYDRGYLASKPTGYFGNMTRLSVKAFQKKNGISQTGYVGPATRKKISGQACVPSI